VRSSRPAHVRLRTSWTKSRQTSAAGPRRVGIAALFTPKPRTVCYLVPRDQGDSRGTPPSIAPGIRAVYASLNAPLRAGAHTIYTSVSKGCRRGTSSSPRAAASVFISTIYRRVPALLRAPRATPRGAAILMSSRRQLSERRVIAHGERKLVPSRRVSFRRLRLDCRVAYRAQLLTRPSSPRRSGFD